MLSLRLLAGFTPLGFAPQPGRAGKVLNCFWRLGGFRHSSYCNILARFGHWSCPRRVPEHNVNEDVAKETGFASRSRFAIDRPRRPGVQDAEQSRAKCGGV